MSRSLLPSPEKSSILGERSLIKVGIVLREAFVKLQRFVNRPWYGPFIGFLAAMDHLVIFIPTDGLLVSASLAVPRKWLRFFLCVVVGSLVGSAVLSLIVQTHGVSFLERVSPGILQSEAWIKTDEWADHYGLWVLAVVSGLPVFQQPAIVLAVLAGVPIPEILLVSLPGRLLKFGGFSWLASHAPHLILRFKRKKLNRPE